MRQNACYAGLLGVLLGVAANQANAGDANVHAASYARINADTAALATSLAARETAARHKFVRAPEFNVIDPINEFSGRDWNGLTPLGKTVTHEMREAQEHDAAKAAAALEQDARAGLY